MEKVVKISATISILLCLILIAGPYTIFKVCDTSVHVMKCTYSCRIILLFSVLSIINKIYLLAKVLWGSISNVAFGQSVSENSEVEVTFETTINFTEEESKQCLATLEAQCLATLEADVKETIEALTNEMLLSNDKIKEDYIESLIDALNNADVADVFDDSKNTSITIPMIAVNVDVGDETSTTNIYCNGKKNLELIGIVLGFQELVTQNLSTRTINRRNL